MGAGARVDGLGWIAIARLGMVQAAIGAIVVLVTSMLNRVLVVEVGLAASIPGALIGFHYALQMLRPCWGHGSDRGGRRTPWIVAGMAVLACGAALATVSAALLTHAFLAGLVLAVAAFALIGAGVGAAGTALLTLLAEGVAPERRPAAAAIAWIMMIAGFVATSGIGSRLLVPFGFARLERFGLGVALIAFLVAWAASRGVERHPRDAVRQAAHAPLRAAIAQVWADRDARRFAVFIFASMLAYGAEELILEPFAAVAFGWPLARTAGLTALQNGGALCGMIAMAVLGRRAGLGARRSVAAVSCLLCAAALIAIAFSGEARAEALLRPAVIGLGIADGLFVVSALGLMMGVAGEGGQAGVRMGVFGAAQAIAFAAGGIVGTGAVDGIRQATGSALPAYAAVFVGEGALFVVAAMLIGDRQVRRRSPARELGWAAAE